MTGISILNSAGSVIIDSSYRSTIYDTRIAIPAAGNNVNTQLTSVGYFNLGLTFGNLSICGYLPTAMHHSGNMIHWLQLNQDKWAFPGAQMFMPSSGYIVKSSRTKAITSGYLDVYATDGKTLLWSAVSAATMPRVIGYLDIPANFDLDGATYTKTLGTANPYFLLSGFPGNLSDDGQTVGYSGMLIKITKSGANFVASVRWVQQYQWSWAQLLKSQGYRIPYAIFPNL